MVIKQDSAHTDGLILRNTLTYFIISIHQNSEINIISIDTKKSEAINNQQEKL